MKKWFMITAGVICFLVVSFISIICFYRIKPEIKFKTPLKILAFKNSIASTEAEGYTEDDKEYGEILKQLEGMLSLTIFEKLKNGNELRNKIYQESDDFPSAEPSTLKANNIVIELQYAPLQDLIIYNGTNTRVISYGWLMVVIPEGETFANINIYFSSTNNESTHGQSYSENDALRVFARTDKIVSYIKSL